MKMNPSKSIDFLLENADDSIKYQMGDKTIVSDKLLHNNEISSWFGRLCERSNTNNIGDIHGSHDYRMENILGKCFILGLNKQIPEFSHNINFILEYLNKHILLETSNELSFGKLYHYRDCEKVLACFLPLLGFYDDPAIIHITKKRIEVLYEFAKQKRYDIYMNGSNLKGVKKEWQPYIINPNLYSNGHIALPDMHDLILFAGMLPHLSNEDQAKIETIVQWFFGEGYKNIIRRYGYFYAPGGSYNSKAIIFKLHLLNFEDMTFDKGDLTSLLFNVYILSFFKSARESLWFSLAMNYLNQYEKDNEIYKFPSYMITEKSDSYVIFGGHMNVGENKKSKLYSEIISTYWISKILQNSSNR